MFSGCSSINFHWAMFNFLLISFSCLINAIPSSVLFSEIGDTFQIPVVQILGGGALYYRIFPEGFIAPIISTQAVDVTGITDNRIFQVKPAG